MPRNLGPQPRHVSQSGIGQYRIQDPCPQRHVTTRGLKLQYPEVANLPF